MAIKQYIVNAVQYNKHGLYEQNRRMHEKRLTEIIFEWGHRLRISRPKMT